MHCKFLQLGVLLASFHLQTVCKNTFVIIAHFILRQTKIKFTFTFIIDFPCCYMFVTVTAVTVTFCYYSFIILII